MMIPTVLIQPQVQAMLAREGIYLLSNPHTKEFAVAHVDANGVCQQLKLDGVLSPDRWFQDAVIRGPLTMDDTPLSTFDGVPPSDSTLQSLWEDLISLRSRHDRMFAWLEGDAHCTCCNESQTCEATKADADQHGNHWVPAEVASALIISKSKGAYVSINIKGKFKTTLFEAKPEKKPSPAAGSVAP